MNEIETKDDFVEELKKHIGSRIKIDDKVAEQIYDMASDAEFADEYRANLITYTSILKSGRYKVSQYINAVKYVTNKISGLSNYDAYKLVFKSKVLAWEKEGRDASRIGINVSSFNNSDLVVALTEQSMIPTHILNQGLFQEALNVAADIMRNSVSDMARVKALDSILSNTKAPEVSKIELDIGMKQNSVINELRNVVQDMAILQAKDIEAGKAVKTIAESAILAEVVEYE